MMLQIVPLLVGLLVVGGCAHIEPYEARDEREEGPRRGILSGSEGEFVIFGKQIKPDTVEKKEEGAVK